MRVSLRLGLTLAIAAILFSTLLIGSVLNYWHADNKVDVEMRSTLAAVQRTVRVALQDIDGSPGERLQVERLIRTFDESRHVRVELKSADDKTIMSSKPAATAGDMPDWFVRLIGPHEETAIIEWPGGRAAGEKIVVTSDPRNEVGEVWGDLRLHLSTLATFCILTLAILSLLLGYALHPIGRLLDAFETMGRGRLGETVPLSGPKEMEQLAKGFNRMSGLLREIDEKNKKLGEQLETLQEEERASLARDLHDEVGPLLFSVDVDATTIRDLAQKKNEEKIADRAEAIQDAVSQVKEQVRSILWQLRPGLLSDLGLSEALENMLAPLRARYPSVTFQLEVPKRSWRPQIDVALLAITREATLNALKHGTPTRIEIRIRSKDGRTVEADILNDGGTLPEHAAAGRLGLVSMDERARLLGGRLDIVNTADGRGVEVKISIPLNGPGAGPAQPIPSTKTLQ